MTIRRILFCAAIVLLWANGATAARYQRCTDGKTQVWNSLRGVAQDVAWSGLRDFNGYATGQGTLTWYRLGAVVNSYTGKMVRGKFEGPVIRQQGNTRLQATFANGEKVSGWSEPGSSPAAVETPAPTEQPENPEETPTESESPPSTPEPRPTPTATSTPTPRPSPSPTPTPRMSPTPTPTPRPSPSPTPTPPLVSPTPIPTATKAPPMSTPMGMPALMPTATPTPVRLVSPSPIEQPSKMASPSGSVVEAPFHTLELARTPEPTVKTEELPRPTASASAKSAPAAAAPNGPSGSRKMNPAAKKQFIAEFKKQIDFVIGQASTATDNFREVQSLEQVKALPTAVSSHVTLLANSAIDFRQRLGYEVTYFECLSEIQAVDSLVVLDESTRSIAAKDAPTGRKTLGTLRSRYSEPSAEAQKPLWRYLNSLYSLCDRLKTEAEGHLQRARSLESEGKKADALREYREIFRLYPNKVTAERIRLLESQSH